MFLELDPVLYIWGYSFIVYVTLFRLIVLYSRCRVNWHTNLSVVLYDIVIFCFASTVRLGLLGVAFPTCGVRPHNVVVHSVRGSNKSRVGGAPKRQAIGSPQIGGFDSADAVYLSGSESESEDEDMCVLFDDEGLAPGPSNRICTYDWDEEQHTTLGMCAAILKRMSLGPDHDASACIDAKNVKKEPAAKRNVKRQKCTTRERGFGQTYKWVVPCYDVNKVLGALQGERSQGGVQRPKNTLETENTKRENYIDVTTTF